MVFVAALFIAPGGNYFSSELVAVYYRCLKISMCRHDTLGTTVGLLANRQTKYPIKHPVKDKGVYQEKGQ